MKYRLALTHEARRQLIEAALWYSEHRSPEHALAWLDGFEAAIEGLKGQPSACSEARESAYFESPLYQLLYGLGRRVTHRAVFRVRDDLVEVVAIRHVAQRDLRPGDLG